MYPSNPNGGGSAPGGVPSKEAEAARLTGPSSASGGTSSAMGSEGYQSSNPSAPLLPSSPYNPSAVPQNLEPPPYSSVVAQDAALGDWKNRSSSFSGGINNSRPYPGAPPSMNASKSTSGLDSNNPPYPTGPSPVTQAPYPANSGYTPYPPAGSVPELRVNAPYPTGPAGYGATNQPPYPGSSMPMPQSIDTERKIGFTVPVTEEPRPSHVQSNPTSPVFHPAPIIANQPQQMQQGMIYPSQVWLPSQRTRLFVFLGGLAFMIVMMVIFISVTGAWHRSFTSSKKSEFF